MLRCRKKYRKALLKQAFGKRVILFGKTSTFAPVKRLSAISMMFVILCATTEMHQLLKLPVLLHHYLEHREKDNSISFLAFLKEHYVHEHAQASRHHHERLPFKSDNCAGAHISIIDPALPGVTSLGKPSRLVPEPILYK
jgi:hypothetical protein